MAQLEMACKRFAALERDFVTGFKVNLIEFADGSEGGLGRLSIIGITPIVRHIKKTSVWWPGNRANEQRSQ